MKKQQQTGKELIIKNLQDAHFLIEEEIMELDIELHDLPQLEVTINSDEPEFDAVATLKQNPIAQKLESKIYNLADAMYGVERAIQSVEYVMNPDD